MPEKFENRQNPQEGEQNEPPSYTPYLYIRCNNSDTGKRPLPPGTQFWTSPDILVMPTDAAGNVQVGTDVTVQARIWNDGLATAIGVSVEFYWVNPSLGIVLNPTQRIGTKLITVPAQNYADVVCPMTWKPAFVNGGHECLIIRCTYPQDPDSGKPPFSPEVNRFVGQRNITVVNQAGFQKLSLLTNNPFKTSQLFEIRLSSLLIRGNFDRLREHDRGMLINLLANVHIENKTQIKEENQLRWEILDVTQKNLNICVTKIVPVDTSFHQNTGQEIEQYLYNRMLQNPDFKSESLGKILHEFIVDPCIANIIEIDIPSTVLGIGQFIIHRFTQVVAGCDIGGYVVVVLPFDF
jgi:hypothetical protein